MGRDLDDEYGATPELSDLDPTHLRALAVRIESLAGQIALLRQEGRIRNEKIDGVQHSVEELREDLGKVNGEIDSIIRSQMTEEDKATLRAIMKSYAFKEQ